MTLRVLGLAFAALGAVGTAGCNMSMPGMGGERPEVAAIEARPAPLRGAPSAPVRRTQLPPVATTAEPGGQLQAAGTTASPSANAGSLSAVAAAEAALANPSGGTAPSAAPAPVQVAAVDAGDVSAAPTPPAAASVSASQAAGPPAAPAGPAVGRGNFAGGWNVSSGGDNCKLFPSLSSWSGGMRASTRGCSSPALKNVSAWSQNGNQVTLMDDSGQPVARLFPTGDKQYNGQTEDGGSISVSR